jgi:hypothetical protein
MAQKETVQQGKQRETELPDLFFNELKLQKKKNTDNGKIHDLLVQIRKNIEFWIELRKRAIQNQETRIQLYHEIYHNTERNQKKKNKSLEILNINNKAFII